jgi:hypothetical protein
VSGRSRMNLIPKNMVIRVIAHRARAAISETPAQHGSVTSEKPNWPLLAMTSPRNSSVSTVETFGPFRSWFSAVAHRKVERFREAAHEILKQPPHGLEACGQHPIRHFVEERRARSQLIEVAGPGFPDPRASRARS